MAVDEAARDRARHRVGDELVRRKMNPTDLARTAGVDVDTVSDFINGRRWPQAAKRGAIANALGWVDEGLDQIVRGNEPSVLRGNTAHLELTGFGGSVGTPQQDEGVLLSMPPEALAGLGPAEREEVIAAARLAGLRAAREIRRRVDDEEHEK